MENMDTNDETPKLNGHCLNNPDDTEHDYTAALKDGIAWLHSDSSLTDITLVVEGEIFPCHRVVLAMFSHYFRAMFACSMREKNECEIVLHSIHARTFKRILKYIYTGNTDYKDLDDLFSVSIYLQIDSLIQVCQKKLCAVLDSANVLNLRRLSKLNLPQCELLHQACTSWLMSSFAANFGKSEDMLSMEKDELLHLISSSLLFAPNEEVVCRNIMSWCNHDSISRNKHLMELFEFVRLPLVKPKFLQTFIDSLTQEQKHLLNPYLSEAVSYQENTARQCDFTSERTENRPASFSEKVLLTIIVDQIWFYSFQKQKWVKLSSNPVRFEQGFGTCTYGQSDLYVTGGYNCYLCYRFNGRSTLCNWQKCPAMLDVRWNHSMIAVDHSIYVLGGNGKGSEKPLDTIEKHTLGTDTWMACGKLLIPASYVATAAVHHKIYLFGGESPERYLQVIQCFCTMTNTTSRITIPELPCSRNVYSVGFDKEIYLLTTNQNKTLIFSFHKDWVKELTSYSSCYRMVHSAKRINFSSIYKRGSKLVLLGGIHPVEESSGQKVYKTSKKIIEIDLKTNKHTELEETLPHRPQGIRCHMITISKSHLQCSKT